MIVFKDRQAILGVVLAFVLLICLAAACDEDGAGARRYEYEEADSETIDVREQTELNIEHTNGVIYINEIGGFQIQFDIIKRVESDSREDAEEHIDDIVVTYETFPEYVYVRVDHPASSRRNYEVDFTIGVPAGFGFNVALGNGVVSFSETTGDPVVSLGNGTIELLDATARNIQAGAGNGEIDADVTLMDTCNVYLGLGNGEITLRIPHDTSAWVEASVGNGEVTHTGLSFEELQSSLDLLVGRLGDGSGAIALSVGNGTIRLEGK